MTDSAKKQLTREEQRRMRQAEQLRINLQRRKAQARARRAGNADDRPSGLASTPEDGDPD